MSNNGLREELTNIIHTRFPELRPITHLIYNNPDAVHYKWNTDQWKHINMKEGVTQGYPLMATLAALKLTRTLQPLFRKF